MRFKLKLSIPDRNRKTLLPINYQYELSSAIYKIIALGNEEFSSFLHEKGFIEKNKQFKLFSFSNLHIPKFGRIDDRLEILSEHVNLIVNFYPIEAIEPFVAGLFSNQIIEVGDRKSTAIFNISGIEKLMVPDFSNSMSFKTLSPINISYLGQNKKHALYLTPEDSRFEELLINNLKNKYIAYQNFNNQPNFLTENFDYELSVGKDIRSKLITIKKDTPQESKIKGFDFSFDLKAPAELLKIGYYAGFGEKNSMGFGCVETWVKREG